MSINKEKQKLNKLHTLIDNNLCQIVRKSDEKRALLNDENASNKLKTTIKPYYQKMLRKLHSDRISIKEEIKAVNLRIHNGK